MDKREARAAGYRAGYAAGTYCEVGEQDRREAGCECGPDRECADCIAQAAFESEQNARQFSPFEFLAHDMNADEDRADGLWEAYDAGVSAGIRKATRRRLAPALTGEVQS